MNVIFYIQGARQKICHDNNFRNPSKISPVLQQLLKILPSWPNSLSEFPSVPCLAGEGGGEKNLVTARVSMLLKSRASLTCFRASFLPGQAKDLLALLYDLEGIEDVMLAQFWRTLTVACCLIPAPRPTSGGTPTPQVIFWFFFQPTMHNIYFFILTILILK
jgi:hypothetical protein